MGNIPADISEYGATVDTPIGPCIKPNDECLYRMLADAGKHQMRAIPEAYADMLLGRRRADLVLRALQEGVLRPDALLEPPSPGRRAEFANPRGCERARGPYPLVHLAAALGEKALLRCLVQEKGVNPGLRDPQGRTVLRAALDAGKAAAALLLVEEAPGCSVRGPERPDGRYPLALAAEKGMLGVMRAMVAKGAEVDAVDNDRFRALSYAVLQRHEACALYLLEEAGATWETPDGTVLLEGAARRGLAGVVRAVLRRMRADVTDELELGAMIVWAASNAAAAGTPAALEALAEDASGPGPRVVIQQPAVFHTACRHGNLEVAAYLAELECCDPLAPYDMGRRAHLEAAASGQLELLQWLIGRFPALVRVDMDGVGDYVGYTSLHAAAEAEAGREAAALEVVKWLVGAGADPRRAWKGPDGVERRPAELADAKGRATIATYLREQEAAAEAAARRARNEKRRQKKKAAKARRQQQAGEEEEEGHEQEQQNGDELLLEAALANLGVADAGDGDGERTTNTAATSASTAPAPAPAPAPIVERPPPLEEYLEADAPDDLVCPITLQLFKDPVVLVGDGFTYSRAAIEQHLATRRRGGLPPTSPQTGLELDAARDVVACNQMARNQMTAHRDAKTREWQAWERRWLEQQEQQAAV